MEFGDDITLFHPNAENFTPQELAPMTEEVAVARQLAISYGGVSTMALIGQCTIPSEYLGDEVSRPVWEFEPHPDFEKLVAKEDTKHSAFFVGTLERVSKANEDRLWHFLETTVEEIKKEEGVSLDIENLTPFQAVVLVWALIHKRMSYEHLISVDNVSNGVEEIVANNETTSREDLLELADSDPKKLKREVKKLKRRIDHMSADEILEYRFGVCRHIAGTAQKLYEVLKKRQSGLLMNGSYLVYHDEGVGEQDSKGLEEGHAYNVFVTTSPKENGEEKMSLSILDPTHMLESENIDFTYKRISQATSFLSEFGSYLGLKETKAVCENLARLGADRLEEYMIATGTIGRIDDYASLLVQSGDVAKKNVVESLKKVFSKTVLDKVEILNRLFFVPVLSRINIKGDRTIRPEYRSKIVEEISHIRFDSLLYRDQLVFLRERIEENVSKIWFTSLKMSFPGIRKSMIQDSNRSFFCLVNEYIRASVGLHIVPPEKMMKIINPMVKIDKIMELGLINKDLVSEIQAMILTNGIR